VALEQSPAVLPESLPAYVRVSSASAMDGAADSASRFSDAAALPLLPDLGEGFDLEARGEDFYRHYIALALERAGGVQVRLQRCSE
jgi:hypothetical protein